MALENSVYAQHVHYLLSNIKSSSFGFCYDSGHESAYTPTEDYLSHYGDILVAMHLHDNDGKHDNHYLPLHKNGVINWEDKISKLKKTKLFNEMITLEAGFDENDIFCGFKEALAVAKKLADM